MVALLIRVDSISAGLRGLEAEDHGLLQVQAGLGSQLQGRNFERAYLH